LATSNKAAKTKAQTLTCKLKLIVLTCFIIPLGNHFRVKEVSQPKDNSSRNKRFDCSNFEYGRTRFSQQD
jgi:hypothetical protein